MLRRAPVAWLSQRRRVSGCPPRLTAAPDPLDRLHELDPTRKWDTPAVCAGAKHAADRLGIGVQLDVELDVGHVIQSSRASCRVAPEVGHGVLTLANPGCCGCPSATGRCGLRLSGVPCRSPNGTGDELRATGVPPRRVALDGLDSLTPTELRIAQLAAGGLSNRAIAETLVVTPKRSSGTSVVSTASSASPAAASSMPACWRHPISRTMWRARRVNAPVRRTGALVHQSRAAVLRRRGRRREPRPFEVLCCA